MAKEKKLRWRTQEGKSLLPSQMEDSHLLNTIAYIKRRVFLAKLGTPTQMDDDTVATMLYPIYPELVRELTKRVLKMQEEANTKKADSGERRFTFEG